MNPPTLGQTPLTLASDFLGDVPANGSTAFGELLALDDGNFAIVEDDSSKVLLTQEGATVVIVDPNGNVVTPKFAVDPTATGGTGIWANCAAYRGGFCVRYNATLYFFDNAGALQGSVAQSTSGISFDMTRGDTTRLASDIRSPYVYLAGAPWPAGATVSPSTSPAPTTGSPVMLAIWNADTLQFVASANVSSDLPVARMIVNGANLAVDALDRVTVGWDCKPTANFSQYHVVARVLQFDGRNVSYLTPSFFPFVNYDPSGILTAQGLVTQTPGIAMTPRQICISCKGVVNSTNNPAAGPDTPPLSSASSGTDLYTVIGHPAPVVAPAPVMTAAMTALPAGNGLIVSWNAEDGLFTVQTTPQLSPSATVWTDFTAGHVAPPVTVPIAPANKYVRLVRAF